MEFIKQHKLSIILGIAVFALILWVCNLKGCKVVLPEKQNQEVEKSLIDSNKTIDKEISDIGTSANTINNYYSKTINNYEKQKNEKINSYSDSTPDAVWNNITDIVQKDNR